MAFTVEFETRKFNQFITNFTRNVSRDKVPLAIKKFAVELLRRILLKMPVDTGRARAAWYASMEGLGVSFNLQRKGPLKAQRGGNLGSVSQGMQEGSFVDNLKGPTPYVELINGCPYIIYLEYGWSGQAPWGMVRISMREMRGGQLPQYMAQGVREEWNKFFWGSARRGMVE